MFKNSKILGDFILHMRFCAKFHLQMCAVLSQYGYHKKALDIANKAVILSEDNILKTYHLYSLIDLSKKKNKDEDNIDLKKTKEKNEDFVSKKDVENINENSDLYIEKIIHEEKLMECKLVINAIHDIIKMNRNKLENKKNNQEEDEKNIKNCNLDLNIELNKISTPREYAF